MDNFRFLGCEKRISQRTNNPYYMLFWGNDVDSRSGKGVKPISSRISADMFSDFSALDFGDIFRCSYQCIQDSKGIYQFIIQQYDLG